MCSPAVFFFAAPHFGPPRLLWVFTEADFTFSSPRKSSVEVRVETHVDAKSLSNLGRLVGSPRWFGMDGSAIIFKAPNFQRQLNTILSWSFEKIWRNKTTWKKKHMAKKMACFFFCWYLTFEKVPVQTFYINLGLFFLRFGPKLRWRRKKLQFFIFRNGKNHHISAWCVRKAQPSTRNYQIIK